MDEYICVTCGVQCTASESPPPRCLVCEDVRQYVNWKGQQWTTLQKLKAEYRNIIQEEEQGLTAVVTQPTFAIGQRALLVRGARGNVLWDCISLIDDATVRALVRLGGIRAVAISHPHFYSSMVEWSSAFGNVPIYLHAADRQWVMRPDPCITLWENETHALDEGLTLVRCGGHFPGSTVLHWAEGANGRGVLLTGDTIFVVNDRRFVSFMFSYPNLIPLTASAINAIVSAVKPLSYDRIYSAWSDRVIPSGAALAVSRSAARYLTATE